MKQRIVRPSGFDSGPISRAFAQDSPGRRLEHRAQRGVETGGTQQMRAAGALRASAPALVNNAD